jgi:hypothetical protein
MMARELVVPWSRARMYFMAAVLSEQRREAILGQHHLRSVKPPYGPEVGDDLLGANLRRAAYRAGWERHAHQIAGRYVCNSFRLL